MTLTLAEDLRAALGEPDDGLLVGGLTLETLLTHPELGAFEPSRVQLALVRAADGTELGDLLTEEEMLEHFGCVRLPSGRPSVLIPRSGVRCGKSLIAAISLLHGVLTADFSGVRSGELVRSLIVTPALATSAGTFHHLVGTMQASPRLRRLFAKDPGSEQCIIRRPDGYVVHVQTAAARAGGLNIRSTWLAGIVFDEADFHRDEDGAVNLPQNFDAAGPRMLPGAQRWVPSSPWADEGPFHEMFTEAFGRPDGFRLAFHASSRAMNPSLEQKPEDDMRAREPDKAAREYDGIPLSANSTLFFPLDALADAIDKTRDVHLEPVRGLKHYAGADLGFKKNSSALAIARFHSAKVQLAYHEELRPKPGKPLKPSIVCQDFALRCVGYGAPSVRGDLHYAETAREEMAEHEVWYDTWDPSSANQTEAFTAFRRLMVERLLELPNDQRLATQIRRTMVKPMPGGRIQIQLPKQGAAHGDVLMAVVLACVQVPLVEPEHEVLRVRSKRR